MKQLDFNSNLLSELSQALFNGKFKVMYLYRTHHKAAIFIHPLTNDDDSLCNLKQVCSSSQSLGPKYVISLDHISCETSYMSSDCHIQLFTAEQYELTMPNNPDFIDLVQYLQNQELLTNVNKSRNLDDLEKRKEV